VSAQHGDLVTEHQDLDILGCIGPGEQGQPAQHADEHQVDESEGHSERSCGVGLGPWPQGRPVAKALIRRMTRFSAPTGSISVNIYLLTDEPESSRATVRD
jgi:hypothetical protein